MFQLFHHSHEKGILQQAFITPSLFLLSTLLYIQYIKYFSLTLPNTAPFTRNVRPLFSDYQLPSHCSHLTRLLRQIFSSYLFFAVIKYPGKEAYGKSVLVWTMRGYRPSPWGKHGSQRLKPTGCIACTVREMKYWVDSTIKLHVLLSGPTSTASFYILKAHDLPKLCDQLGYSIQTYEFIGDHNQTVTIAFNLDICLESKSPHCCDFSTQ